MQRFRLNEQLDSLCLLFLLPSLLVAISRSQHHALFNILYKQSYLVHLLSPYMYICLNGYSIDTGVDILQIFFLCKRIMQSHY